MSKNSGKSKLSKTILFNANKHVFHCEKSLGTLFCGGKKNNTDGSREYNHENYTENPHPETPMQKKLVFTCHKIPVYP
jgi:hypothetical protein